MNNNISVDYVVETKNGKEKRYLDIKCPDIRYKFTPTDIKVSLEDADTLVKIINDELTKVLMDKGVQVEDFQPH